MGHTEIHIRRQVCQKNAGMLVTVLIKCYRKKRPLSQVVFSDKMLILGTGS